MSSNLAKRSSSFSNSEMMNNSNIEVSSYSRAKSHKKIWEKQDFIIN
jgi:hypothetical protein